VILSALLLSPGRSPDHWVPGQLPVAFAGTCSLSAHFSSTAGHKQGREERRDSWAICKKTLSISNFAASCKLAQNQKFSQDFDLKRHPPLGEEEFLQMIE